MAQALYDEHPLDTYLREFGDSPNHVPGAFTDSSDEEREVEDIVVNSDDSQWKRASVAIAAGTLRKWTSTFRSLLPSPNNDFAERFKYDLISSNLLSTSVATTPLVSQPRTRPSSPGPSLPGDLPIPQQDVVEKSKQELKSLSSAFVFVGLAALLNQYRVAAALAMFTSLTVAKSSETTTMNKNYIPQMFEALKNLKAAGMLWDALVNDSLTTLEQEENSPFPSSSTGTPPSPSSALRIALHSTLLTTQNQCDNVRPLLAAVASPMELSQLAEMYAPSSPIKPSFSLQTRATPPRHGRISLSENAISSLISTPRTTTSEKRRTWNGANTTFFDVSARSSSVLQKRDRRRSDLASFLESQKSPPSTSSAPLSPSPLSPTLTQVLEVDEDEDDVSIDELDSSKDNFGTAALFLRRKRRARAIDALGLSSSKSVPALRNLQSPPLPSLSSSRFTSMQSSRHPLSISALHHAIQGALSARRYACAHLLALRFDEDAEDDAYWENVQSVIDLLTSTLEDGAARLRDALEEADRMKRQESQPSPSPSPCPTPGNETADMSFTTSTQRSLYSSLPSSKLRLSLSVPSQSQIPLSPLGAQSFAPVPTRLGRFASHMDAVSSALDDARDHMDHCLSTLREQELCESPQIEHVDDDAEEQAIFQSYDRMRKELGLALRECERGKAALADVFEARRMQRRLALALDTEEQSIHRDMSSGGSADSDDKHDAGPYTPNEGSPVLPSLPSLDSILATHYQVNSHSVIEDDVTEHLLASSSSSHLPPPGVEQVYEAEVMENDRFTRERSKLTREERIKLLKAKRESMRSSFMDEPMEAAARRVRMGWGPGPEVIEELKDVIWKVGERRRKMPSNLTPSEIISSIPRTTKSTTATVPPSQHPDDFEFEALAVPLAPLSES